jgi:hypothetical protein
LRFPDPRHSEIVSGLRKNLPKIPQDRQRHCTAVLLGLSRDAMKGQESNWDYYANISNHRSAAGEATVQPPESLNRIPTRHRGEGRPF